MSAPVDSLPPEVAFSPVQAPEAVQELALVEDQVSVEDPPFATDDGFAASDTVGVGDGGGASNTTTITVAVALPPEPVQVREKLALAVSGPVGWLPDVVWVPDQPPESVQEVAFVEDQISVEDSPLATDGEPAVSDTVGTGGGGGAEPPEPPPPPPPQAERPRAASRAANAKCVRFDTSAPRLSELISRIPAPENPVVLRPGSAAVSPMGRGQRSALTSEMLIERITIVDTIPDRPLGSSHGDGLSEGSFDKGDFMWRMRSGVHGERKTRSVCNSHDFVPLPRLVIPTAKLLLRHLEGGIDNALLVGQPFAFFQARKFSMAPRTSTGLFIK